MKTLYSASELNPQLIIALYLYGDDVVPPLVDEGLIRPQLPSGAAAVTINVDMPSFMTTAGRFADPAMSSLVASFFNSTSFALSGNGETRQEFSVQQMINIVGGSQNFSLQQYNFADSSLDLAVRTFIYNTSGFKLSNSAVFVIAANGDRSIEGAAVQALDDNFDFNSDN